MADRVWMVHPDLPGARISCAPSGVGARQQSGWTVDETQDTAGTSDAAVEAARDLLVGAGWTVTPPLEPVGEVPDGPVDDVLRWVGNSRDAAQAALDAEQSRPNPRTTLIAALEKLAAPVESEEE